jgi:hypothetical protein
MTKANYWFLFVIFTAFALYMLAAINSPQLLPMVEIHPDMIVEVKK